jgi:hypothetical protein
MAQTTTGKGTILGATLLPAAIAVGAASARALTWQEVPRLLVGLAISLAGGALAGLVARRLLRAPRNSLELILGIVLTGAIGTLTLGYLYLAHFDFAIASIGSGVRAIEQGIAFGQFLAGLGVGALWPRKLQGDG